MKKITLFALALVALASCGKDSSNDPAIDSTTSTNNPVAVTFNSAIETRASGTTWSANDQIGVYMVDGSDITYANVPYITKTTSDSGSFTPSGETTIYYPQTGTVDFVSYYPYQSGMGEDYIYSVDVSDQTDLEAIDLMVATKLTGVSSSTSAQSLSFSHKLSEIVLTIKPSGELTSIADDLEATLSDIYTTQGYNVSTLAFDGAAGDKDDVELSVAIAGDKLSATVTVIMLPQTLSSNILTITMSGKTYIGYISQVLETGKSYAFTNVPVGQYSFSVAGATITPWGDGTETDGGTINTQMQ